MYKTRISYISFIVALIVCSCTQQQNQLNSKTFILGDLGRNITLDCEPLPLAEPVLRPVKLSVVDSFLIVINAHSGTFVQRFSLSGLEQTGEFISFGSGPDDMIAPIGLSGDASGVSILDGGKRELFIYPPADFCFDEDPKKIRSVKFNEFIDNVSELADGRLVGTVRQEGHNRLSFFDANGSLLNTIGAYPFSDLFDPDMTHLLLAASSCSLITNEQKDKICITYMLSDLIEIYDDAGRLLRRVHGPDQFLPEVALKDTRHGKQIKHTEDQTRDAYFSPVAYRDEIYVLYSGRVYTPDNHDMKSDQIFVFDWEGNPQRRYTLSAPVYAFTIDPQSGTLYGLSDSPEFHVVKAFL